MATRPKGLRAVSEDERPAAPVVPKSISEAAKDGTTRELLVAMRDRIAETVEDRNTMARDLAALTRRLIEVTRDIEAIDAREAQEAVRGHGAVDGAFDAAAI